MSDKQFYVYEYIRPDTGDVFYVGKGKGRRAFKLRRRRGRYYVNVIAKLERLGLGVEIRIVKSGLSERQAFKLEQKLIAFYGRYDLRKGPLANCTVGGEGVAGWPRSKKWRRKLSKRMQGNQYAVGLRHSDEVKANLSKLHKTLQANGGYTKGRVFTDENRAKLREARARWTPEQQQSWRERVSEQMRGNAHTLGHKLTDEHKAKISASQKGKPKLKLRGRHPTAETRAKLSAAHKGKPKSLSHRLAIGTAHKGRVKGPLSPEVRAKISAALRGRPKSLEWCAKISAAQKGKPKKRKQVSSQEMSDAF
jgi:NUMOD3 motif